MSETIAEPTKTVDNVVSDFFTEDEEDFHSHLHAFAKYKERSHVTNDTKHLPQLAAALNNAFDVVLIGDSRIERFNWYATESKMNNLPRTFNAGVGGDKIENVLYRMDKELLKAMAGKLPKLWVVSIGTNNLNPKSVTYGLDATAFKLLIIALLRRAPDSRVLMTEMSCRKDIDDSVVRSVNISLRGMVTEINDEARSERVLWHTMPALERKHLLDHVHFNEEGYRLWDEKLYNEVQELLKA